MARYGMVMDMRTCVGCQACMAACTAENQTPFWNEKFRTHVEDKAEGIFPDVRRVLLPRLCMHCENTPCLTACPTGATYMTEDGIVKVNYDRCIGCYACCIACPYDARYAYDGEDVKKEEEVYGKFTSTISRMLTNAHSATTGFQRGANPHASAPARPIQGFSATSTIPKAKYTNWQRAAKPGIEPAARNIPESILHPIIV